MLHAGASHTKFLKTHRFSFRAKEYYRNVHQASVLTDNIGLHKLVQLLASPHWETLLQPSFILFFNLRGIGWSVVKSSSRATDRELPSLNATS